MEISDQQVSALRRKIIRWYRKNKRDLPWRRTKDPYAILVSEVMLQQTQVLRVLPKYAEFIEAYPTVDALADSPLSSVLKIWSGLGYNRRAKYLKEMAGMVKNGYNGHIPNTYEELRKLPGIGDYTANAVLCFAFGQPAPAVDTNVRNVIERELFGDRKMPLSELKPVVWKLLDTISPGEALHAVMDYSAVKLGRPKRHSTSTTVPFHQSHRYVRGRLLKVLVERAYELPELISVVSGQTGRRRRDVHRAVSELTAEGMIRSVASSGKEMVSIEQ